MAISSVRESVLPTAWSEVLDNVLQALDHTAKEAARRSEALEASAPPDEVSGAGGHAPRSFDELRAIVRRAEQAVAEADELIRAEEQVVRQGLEKLAGLGRRLAEGTAGGV
jgi:hypothetical protein